jgi:hypothetical protein
VSDRCGVDLCVDVCGRMRGPAARHTLRLISHRPQPPLAPHRHHHHRVIIQFRRLGTDRTGIWHDPLLWHRPCPSLLVMPPAWLVRTDNRILTAASSSTTTIQDRTWTVWTSRLTINSTAAHGGLSLPACLTLLTAANGGESFSRFIHSCRVLRLIWAPCASLADATH